MRLQIEPPNEKQKLFLQDREHKYIAYGGARGGGKSWAVRTKAKLLSLRYAGIRILIVRRSYPELINNHINTLRRELLGVAKYNDKDKVLKFLNGSTINFAYCERDKDLDRLQGVEYDVIFIDEATHLSEYQMKVIKACIRGVNKYPKRLYLTCNPGGQGHAYIKRLFIDRKFEEGEDPAEYAFVQALVKDNKALMATQPEYIKQLESLPGHLREMWLEGRWDVFAGQFFEELRLDPDPMRCEEAGITVEEARAQRRFTHVIEPFKIPMGWKIYRSYDFGYQKPFSLAWWAVDYDGVLYRILELYGCTREPNEGVRWTPDEQFRTARELERTHPLLAGRKIDGGVADPAIWDGSRGESVQETASRYGIYFTKGDNERIAGWMQCHYRLQFDSEGYPRCYIFDTCKAFMRTVPLLMYSETRPEDLDTDLEDHVADEWRYFCMSRPVKPILEIKKEPSWGDPLDQLRRKG